jgi:hypothetical protein
MPFLPVNAAADTARAVTRSLATRTCSTSAQMPESIIATPKTSFQ